MASFEPPSTDDYASIEEYIRDRFKEEKDKWWKRQSQNGVLILSFRLLAAGIRYLVSPQDVKQQARYCLPVQISWQDDKDYMDIPSYDGSTKKQKKEQKKRQEKDRLACQALDDIDIEKTIQSPTWSFSFLAHRNTLDKLIAHPQFKKLERIYTSGLPQPSSYFIIDSEQKTLTSALQQAFTDYNAPRLTVNFTESPHDHKIRQKRAAQEVGFSNNMMTELVFEITPAYMPEQQENAVQQHAQLDQIDIKALTKMSAPVEFSFTLAREEMEKTSTRDLLDDMEEKMRPAFYNPLSADPQ